MLSRQKFTKRQLKYKQNPCTQTEEVKTLIRRKKYMYLLQIDKKSRSPFITCERVTKRVANAKIEIYKSAFSVLALW